MKNAKELILEFTAFSIRDPKKAAEMFPNDGASEMPYLAFDTPDQAFGEYEFTAVSSKTGRSANKLPGLRHLAINRRCTSGSLWSISMTMYF